MAQHGAVVDLGGGDLSGGHGLTLAQLDDVGDGQLVLTLIGAGGAGHTHPVADLEVTGHGEAVDAAGLVLHVDAVEEGRLLVIAGGVGGDHALDGVLVAVLGLGLHLGDGRDLHGVDEPQQILADLVVGVVLLGAVVADAGLHLKVGHEGRTGDHHHATALQLLGGHDHQAAVVFGKGILGRTGAAQTVLIHVHGVGGGMAIHHGGHGSGQRGGGVAACVHGIDGRTAVVAEALGVELVIGMVGIDLHAVHQGVVHVVGAEVQPPLIHAVGGAANVVIGGVVADAEAGAQGRQHLILGGCHVLDGGVALNDVVVLVVVGPARQNDGASGCVEGVDGRQLVSTVRLGIGLSGLQTAAGSGEDQSLELGIATGGDELLAGVQLHGPDAVLSGQIAEVAHGILIVARHILVVVGGVDADVHQCIRIEHIQIDGLGEGVLLAVLLHHGGDLNGEHTGGGGGVVEGDIQRAALAQRVALVALALIHADDGAADGVGQGLDGGIGVLAVEEGGGQGQLLVGDGSGGAADHVGDAQLQALTHPHGGGDRQIAVPLGDTDEIVAVIRIQRHGQAALIQLGGVGPGVDHFAGVDHHLHLGDGVALVGIVDGDLKIQLLGDLGDTGAHHLTVDGVAQLQVLILGGVHPQGPDGLVDALFGEVVGEDNVTGVVGIAPAALVVVLVVGGSQVPALIQRHDVLLIAGIVAAGADLALAVTHLHHIHTAVNDGIPVGEVTEVTEGGAGMVELADGVHTLGLTQQSVVGLHTGVVGLVVEGGVVAGDHAGGVEGVDVAGAAGPCHLEAAQRHHGTGVLGVEGIDGALIGAPAVVGVGVLHQRGVIQSALHVSIGLGVEVVGVVGEGHELHVGAGGDALDVVQRRGQRTGAVGILGVAVELTEVQLILSLAHGEEPVEAGLLAVGTLGGDHHLRAAVGEVGSGRVGDTTIGIHSIHSLAVHRHGDGGLRPGIGQRHRDGGPLVAAGLSTPHGRGIGEHRLVLHGDLHRAGDGLALIVHAADGYGEFVARHLLHGDGDGVNTLLLGDSQGLARQRGGHVALDTEGSIHGEAKGVGLPHIGVIQVVDDHGGHIHDAAGQLRPLRHGIEGEGVDGVVQITGGAVHTVHLEAVAEVLQPLAVALILGGAALHFVAAHVAGALPDQPVGVLTGGGEIEGVVAGAVGTQIAVGVVAEAIVLAAALHGKDHGAVGADSLAVGNGGGRLVDGGAVGVVILLRQNRLSVLVVDDHLIAGLRQLTGDGRRHMGDIVAAGAVAELIGAVVGGAAGIQGRDVGLSSIGGQRHTLEELGAAGGVGDGGAAGSVVGTQCHVLDVDVLTEIVGAHLGDGDLLCGDGLHTGLYHLHGRGLHLRHAAVEANGAGDLHHVAYLIVGVVGVIIDLEAVDLTADDVLQNDGTDAGSAVIGVAVVIHHLTHHGDIFGLGGDGPGLLDGERPVGDHAVRDGVIDGTGGPDLVGNGIPQLQGAVVGAYGGGNIYLVTHGKGPAVSVLGQNCLIELDGLTVGILEGDVGVGVLTVVVVDLSDLQPLQLHIGTHIVGGQSGDGGGLGVQRQAAGLDEGAAAQLRHAPELGPLAGADDGVAQSDLIGLGGQPQTDSAGGVLQIVVLAVHQRHNALDGELGVGGALQRRADRYGGGLLRIRLRGGVHVLLLLRQLVEGHAEVRFLQPVSAGAVGGELGELGEVFQVDLAVLPGDAAAGEVVGGVLGIAGLHIPASGAVGGHVEMELAIIFTQRQGLAVLGEGIGAVIVGGDIPDQRIHGVGGEHILFHRGGHGGQVVIAHHGGADGKAVAGVENDHLVATGEGSGLDVLVHQTIGLVGEHDLLTVGHAVLHSLDGDGAGGGDGHRAGVVLIGAVIHLVPQGGIRRLAGKGHGVAHLHIAGGGTGGGSYLLQPAAQLIEGEVAGVAAGRLGDSGVLVSPELVLGAGVAGQLDRVIALSGEGKGPVGGIEIHGPPVAAAFNAIVVAAFGSNGLAVGVTENGTILAHGQRPDAARGINDLIVGSCHGHCRDPCAVQHTGGVAVVGYHHILAGDQFIGGRDLGVGLCR